MLHCRAGVLPDAREKRVVATEIIDYRNRIDQLLSRSGSPPWHTSLTTVQSEVPSNRIGDAIIIDNTLRPARRNLSVDVPSSSWILGLSPRRVVEHIFKTGLTIDAKNGFHACFYGNLGLKAAYEARGTRRLRIPFLAANELLVIRKPKSRFRSHLRGARARLRRLGRRNRPTRNEVSDRLAQ
jgi:hypothetical protein